MKKQFEVLKKLMGDSQVDTVICATDTKRKGIGIPATRAGILEKLIKSGLAERKGDKKVKYFTATRKGTALITVLPEQVQSPLMIAEWEEKLKLVERGELPSLRW